MSDCGAFHEVPATCGLGVVVWHVSLYPGYLTLFLGVTPYFSRRAPSRLPPVLRDCHLLLLSCTTHTQRRARAGMAETKAHDASRNNVVVKVRYVFSAVPLGFEAISPLCPASKFLWEARLRQGHETEILLCACAPRADVLIGCSRDSIGISTWGREARVLDAGATCEVFSVPLTQSVVSSI